MSKQFIDPTDGGVGGGEGAGDVLHPNLSVGLLADTFCLWSEHVFRLDMYNSAICQVLVERDTERERQTDTLSVIHTQTHTHTERQAHREREMEWLVKAAEGSNEIGAA